MRSNGSKLPFFDNRDRFETLVKRGGAILPEQIDLERLLVRKRIMGGDAPKVRVVVGKNYGQDSDGTPKPVRAILEEWGY